MKSESFDFYQHLNKEEKNKTIHKDGNDLESVDDDDDDDPELVIDFILPTKDIFTFDLTGCLHLYIKDIKYKLYMKKIGIHPFRMNLLNGNKIMKDNDLLSHYHLKNKQVIHVLLKVIGVPPLFFHYDEFITSMIPSISDNKSHCISILTQFELVFQPNLCNHIVNMESLINRNCLKTIFYDPDRQRQVSLLNLPEENRLFLSSNNNTSMSSQHPSTLADSFNLVTTTTNTNTSPTTRSKATNSMLFSENKKWTNYAPETNILLLKVEETLSLHLHRILYSIEDVLAGRKEVDDDSWQRYTNVLPIDCNVIIDNNYREYPLHVKLIPYQPLEYNTCYAVFLKCGVATIPSAMDAKWSFEYLSDGIGWDKVIIYKTESAP